MFLRYKWHGRRIHKVRNRRQVVRCLRCIVEVATDHLGSRWQRNHATENLRARGELEGKLGDDPEVPATAVNRPKEICVLVGTRGDNLTRGCDDLCREQVID